jgi:hypothetical protein
MAKNNSFNWSRAFRDVVVVSINKGQLPILGLYAIVIIVICRLPVHDIVTLAHDIVDKLAKGELAGYGLSVVVSLGWWMQAKKARTNHTNEINRICQEKTDLQNRLSAIDFNSSRPRKK